MCVCALGDCELFGECFFLLRTLCFGFPTYESESTYKTMRAFLCMWKPLMCVRIRVWFDTMCGSDGCYWRFGRHIEPNKQTKIEVLFGLSLCRLWLTLKRTFIDIIHMNMNYRLLCVSLLYFYIYESVIYRHSKLWRLVND